VSPGVWPLAPGSPAAGAYRPGAAQVWVLAPGELTQQTMRLTRQGWAPGWRVPWSGHGQGRIPGQLTPGPRVGCPWRGRRRAGTEASHPENSGGSSTVAGGRCGSHHL